MTRDKALKALSHGQGAFRDLGVKALYLFGSTARNTARRGSDIDLFVDIRDPKRFSVFDLLDVKYRAEHLLRRPVDVTTRDGLHPVLKPSILAEAVRVF